MRRRRCRRLSALVAFPSAAALGTVAVLVSGCQHRPAGVVTGIPPSPPIVNRLSPVAVVSSALSPPQTVASSAKEAAALWKKTLAAARTIPLKGQVTDTRFDSQGRPQETDEYTVVEGISSDGPQCRQTIRLPAERAGEVIISSPHEVWRFVPHANIVTELPASALPPPAQWDEGAGGSVVASENMAPETEPRPETIDGKATFVLALRSERSRRIVERRWIDAATGRTLRWEAYGRPDARLLRRVEVSDITYLPPAAAPALTAADADNPFQPVFAPNTVVIDRRGRRVRLQDDAEKAARNAHLPLHVRGYAVRTVERSARIRATLQTALRSASAFPAKHRSSEPKTAGSESATTHLLYSRGEDAISVFVTNSATLAGGRAVDLRPGEGWQPAILDTGRRGFTQETDDGAAVAWNEPRRGFYMVLARMPLSELLPVAGAFAADRDDAPAAISAAVPAVLLRKTPTAKAAASPVAVAP